MSKNYLLGFTILFLTACGGSDSGPSGSSSTGPSNAAPVISSGNTYSVAENTTAIGTVQASDADGDALAYFIQGDDSSLVTLTGNVLSFTTAPDFEAPADANSDNVYKVTVVVSDGSAKDAKDLEISVTNVNEGPQIIADASYSVAENSTAVGVITVSDAGDSTVTFSLSGADSALMTIGESSGVLAFVSAPDYENPADAGADNTYNVTVGASDGTVTNTVDVAVVVTDIASECPGACDLFFSEYAEGSSNNKYLEIANFTGAEVALSGYSLPSTSNAPTTPGEYEYWNGDVFGANDVVADGDVYVVCHGSADQSILDECDATTNFLSNGDDGRKLVKGTEDSFTVVDVLGDFQADPGSGWDVCGVSNGTKDHTLVKKEGKEGNADWTSSRGTNETDCDWIVADSDATVNGTWDGLGKHCYDSSAAAVTISSDSTFSVAENTTAVGTVVASAGGCASGTVSFTLSGADSALFTIDAAGALAFAAAPDFEVTGSASGTNDYTVVVTATVGSDSVDATLTVTVTDVVEADPTKVDFSGAFGGAGYDAATSTHTFPTGAEGYAGFANNNADLYPFTFPNGGTVTFTAAAPGADVNVNFRFERLPFPDVDPAFNTANVTISGAEEKTYTVEFDAQGENTFRSLIMYIVERDIAVVIKDVVVAQKAATPAGSLMDMSGTFGAVGYNAETNGYNFLSTAEVWGGWAHAAESGTDMYPFTFTEAGKVTFKATAPNGDVTLKFKFERLPYPDTTPEFYTATVVVTGAEEATYEVAVPSQGTNTFSSFLMYFEERDVEVYITDVYVTADEKVDTGNGGGTLDMNEAFGGFVIGDVVTAGSVTGRTYTHPTGTEVWAGVAHDPTKTDVYPMKFPNGGVVTAKMAAVTGDVVMNFKAEFASQSSIIWQGVSKSVSSSGGTYTWEIPATTDTYGNFLLYIDERDETLVVESVVVTPND
ncbi:hypothetical protein N9J68_03345 [Gammaproteobacteria bacterium]|nr:hypothetical protein [Gammaproteobacteria bacterium]